MVLVNCCFPFDADVIAKLNKLSAVNHVYRTPGIYHLIVQVRADIENGLRRTVCADIGTIRSVDSPVTMVIA